MSFLDKMRTDAPAPARVLDPVCHMTIDPARAAATSTHGDRTVHFCSAGCKRAFDAAPAKYLPEERERP